MRYIAFALVLILAFASAQITLNKASSIAQKALEVETSPQSNPGIPSKLDNTSYYVIEFDNYWLPVREDGNYSRNFDQDYFQAVKLHEYAQQMVLARGNEGYLTKLVPNLVLLKGNVEVKIGYYETYIPQLPRELKPGAQALLDKARDLRDRIEKAIDDLNDLKEIEDGILSSWIDQEKIASWKKKFSQSLQDIRAVSQTGREFDKLKNSFLANATAYAQNESNDLESRNLVASFASNIPISGIPSSLGQFETAVDNWNNWLNTVMSDQSISQKAKENYLNALDRVAYVDVKSLRIKAYAKVSIVKESFEKINSRIGYCVSDLPSSKRKKFEDARDYYNKSISSYNQGSILMNQSKYEEARKSFQNAIGWAEKAEPLISSLNKVSCPEQPSPRPSPGIVEMIQKNWVLIVGFLVFLLIIIYFLTRPKKPKEEGGEYYPEYWGENEYDQEY